MRAEDFRSSFVCHFVDSDESRSVPIQAILKGAGYRVVSCKSIEESFRDFNKFPPHFIFLIYEDFEGQLTEILEKYRRELPESQVFVFHSREKLHSSELLNKEIYECFSLPIVNPRFLIRSIDRAAELNYRIYTNEQLRARIDVLESKAKAIGQEAEATPVSPIHPYRNTSGDFNDFRLFVEALSNSRTIDEATESYFRYLSTQFPDRDFIFFRYHQARRALVGRHHLGPRKKNVTELGLEFNKLRPGFRTELLRDEALMQELFKEFVKAEFGEDAFWVKTLTVFDVINGAFLELVETQEVASGDSGLADDGAIRILQERLEYLVMQRRLHSHYSLDPITDALNRPQFEQRVEEEIARSRRIGYSFSVVRVRIDRFDKIVSRLGEDDSKVLLRIVGKIFRKHSRVNDFVGRMGAADFALALPHTPKRGAVVKAERMRRAIASAKFDKFLPDLGRVSLSFGVSEYPSLSHDGAELLESAELVLDEVSKDGNQVGLAQVGEGFSPDFIPRDHQ